LKCPGGNTVDPMIECACLNIKKYTTAKDDIGATGLVTWNEHLFFEPKNVVWISQMILNKKLSFL
jgi:hypothetical protein